MKTQDPRWQRKRLEIFNRDAWKCVQCNDSTTELHVHHKVYRGELWEAHNDELQTLCHKCHSALGPHPHGGIWWEDGFATFSHCPLCGGKELHDKGSFDKCLTCGNRITYIEPPEQVA